jgi:hypothetical protein
MLACFLTHTCPDTSPLLFVEIPCSTLAEVIATSRNCDVLEFDEPRVHAEKLNLDFGYWEAEKDTTREKEKRQMGYSEFSGKDM